MGMLQKINRKMRNAKFDFSPLVVHINHPLFGHGFCLLRVERELETDSMLMLTVKMPVHKGQKAIIWWDFLFLRNFIHEKVNDISEDMLWNKGKVRWHHRVFHRLFKTI